jgi:uncharacterized protein YecT (DUF1311 family)/surface antigen
MRSPILAALSISLLSIVLPASAQNQDDRYRTDVESQYRYRDTSQADVDAANRRLNDIYQRRIVEARAADRASRRNWRNWYSQETALRNAERYWVSYRDADCRYVAQPYAGQRQYDGYRRGCLVDRTNERAADLRQSRLTAGGNDDRDQRWRQRYARTYSYNDDTFYQQCRNGPDPAAVITGGLIGGLVGNAAGRDDNRTGGTIAGVIVGAAIGAALTNDMECQDRSYAYRSYYDGLNSNRPNSDYDWRNQSNGNYGRFHVDQYYDDPDGFRCATYRQTATINRRSRDAQGHACQQPNGVWVVVD